MNIQECVIIDGQAFPCIRPMTAEEELICPPCEEPTLQEKIENCLDYPEINEIMAQLIDIPEEESEENGNEDTD